MKIDMNKIRENQLNLKNYKIYKIKKNQI